MRSELITVDPWVSFLRGSAASAAFSGVCCRRARLARLTGSLHERTKDRGVALDVDQLDAVESCPSLSSCIVTTMPFGLRMLMMLGPPAWPGLGAAATTGLSTAAAGEAVGDVAAAAAIIVDNQGYCEPSPRAED